MRLVRFATWSRYGHACIAETVNPSGTIVVIEAMPGGCRRRTARAREFVWSDVPLTDGQRDTVVGYAVETIGTPYDVPAIWRFVGRWWAARLWPWRRRRNTARALVAEPGAGTLICSELVARAYLRAGVDVCGGKPPDAVSPGDLRQWLDDQRRALRRP